MNVQPQADSNTKLKWVNHIHKSQKVNGSILAKDENLNAFISDFTSPADQIPNTHTLSRKSEKSDKKKRLPSHTSENWIG